MIFRPEGILPDERRSEELRESKSDAPDENDSPPSAVAAPDAGRKA
jgi:hypothetical protein